MPTAMTLTDQSPLTFEPPRMTHLNVRTGKPVLIKKRLNANPKTKVRNNQIDIMSLAGSLQGKTDIRLTNDALQAAITDSYVQSGLQGLK